MQHKLAELKTEICVGRAFVDNCIELHAEKRLDPATASMAKLWWAAPPLHERTLARCA